MDVINAQAAMMMRIDAAKKAIKAGDLALVQAMIDRAELDINFLRSNLRPLEAALGVGDPALVRLLIEQGADPDLLDANNEGLRDRLEAAGISGQARA
jgi:hypothetical protein